VNCKYRHVDQATGIPPPRTLETNKQTNSFVRFLGESAAQQFCFKIY
jgi:hypothetical protein